MDAKGRKKGGHQARTRRRPAECAKPIKALLAVTVAHRPFTGTQFNTAQDELKLARRIEPAEREHGGRALRENLLAKLIAYWRKPAPSHE